MNINGMNSGSEENLWKCRLNLTDMDGLNMMTQGLFSIENFRATVNLQLEAGDVIVSTYPKCGTTWCQYIVWNIVHGVDDPHPTVHEINNELFPFLELNGVDLLKDRPHPWYLKVHLPYKYTPKHPEAKCIYVARNPKDCCVSYYPFLKQASNGLIPDDMTFEEFFEHFVRGQVPWGHQLDHVMSWYEHKDDPNVLFLTYEELKADPKKMVLKIAKFLGSEYEQQLIDDDKMVDKIVERTCFDSMKTLPYIIPASADSWKSSGKHPNEEDVHANPDKLIKLDFFRAGHVGDWKNHFTEDMSRRLDELMDERLKSTYFYNLWRKKQNV